MVKSESLPNEGNYTTVNKKAVMKNSNVEGKKNPQ